MIKIFFGKIAKIFYIFICCIFIIGIILYSVENYLVPEVKYSGIVPQYNDRAVRNFTGQVVPRGNQTVEVIAAQDMLISDIDIKNGEVIEGKTKLFTFDINDASLNKQDTYDSYNDKISDIQDDINDMLRAISKKIGKDIKHINELDPNEGIDIVASADGQIKDLSIQKGKEVNSALIANVINDNGIVISFKMTPEEYNSLSVGDEMLITYTGYDGYYNGKITKLNPNPVATKENLTYLYTGTIETNNPGLVHPGIAVGVSTQINGKVVSTLTNGGVIESYEEQEKIVSPMCSTGNRKIYATDVYVIERENVKKGQVIATIGGKDLADELNSDIKAVRDRMKDLSRLQEDVGELYSDILDVNTKNDIIIDADGTCSTKMKIVMDYMTDDAKIQKGQTICKFHRYNATECTIFASISVEDYKNIQFEMNKLLYGENWYNIYKHAELENVRKFTDHYELNFVLQPEDKAFLGAGDKVYFEYILQYQCDMAVLKTAIVPIDNIEEGKKCYIYIIDTEHTILGPKKVLQEKLATIGYVGDKYVSVKFEEPIDMERETIYVVNYINSKLEDGMRVKMK